MGVMWVHMCTHGSQNLDSAYTEVGYFCLGLAGVSTFIHSNLFYCINRISGLLY
jgi:hypothetical protein